MIENLARVDRREGNLVTVTAASPTGCARCDAGEGCGGGVFGKLINRRLSGLQLEDTELNLQPEQYVVIGLPDGLFLKITLLTYGLPLLAMLLMSALAVSLGAADGLSAIAGLCGLAAGLLLVPVLRKKLFDRDLKPRLLRRTNPAQWECARD